MSNPLRRLGKDTLNYGLAGILQKALAFLLFPFYARLLSSPEFGVQDLVASLLLVAGMLLTLGMDSATLLHYYEAQGEERDRLVGTWVSSQIAGSTVLAIVLLAAVSFLPPAGPADTWSYTLAILSIPLAQTTRALQFVIRLGFRPWAYSAIAIAGLVAQTTAGVLFVVVWRLGLHGVFGAVLAGTAAQAAVAVAVSAGTVRLRFSGPWARRLLAVGLPLVPGAAAAWTIGQVNRFVLAGYQGLTEVALFGVAMRVSSILLFALSAFEVAWGPFALSIAARRDEAKEAYARALTGLVVVGALGAVGLSIFSRELLAVLAGPRYVHAAPLIPLQCFGYLAWVSAYVAGIGAAVERKTYHTSIGVTISALVTLCGGLLFAPPLGAWGAVLGTFAGQVTYLAYMFHAGQKYLAVPYDLKAITLVLGTSLAVVAFGMWLDAGASLPVPVLVAVKLALVGMLVGSWFAGRIGLGAQLRAAFGRP